MKKITAVMALAIAASMSVTAFAATAQLDGENPSGGGNVNALYTESVPWNPADIDAEGRGEITLPDGTKVIVENADSTKRLIIDSVTEQDALEWLKGTLAGKADGIKAYHIYYLDGDKVLPANEVKLTIDVSGNAVYSVTAEGQSTELSANSSDAGLTFTTDGAPYYAIGTKPQDASSQEPSTSDSNSDGSTSTPEQNSSSNTDGSQAQSTSQASSQGTKPAGDGRSPNTGMAAGAAALALLGGAAVITAAKSRDKKEDK